MHWTNSKSAQRLSRARLFRTADGLYGPRQWVVRHPDGDISLARSVMPELPVAGAFCNGEIGPVAGNTHLHGYAAAWGLLRHSPLKTTDSLSS